MTMLRPSYRTAIRWIAENDDNEWLDPRPDLDGVEIIPSVTASMVADLYGVTTDKVTVDLRRALEKI